MGYNTKLACPVQRTIAMIADKYKILVLEELLEDTRRFGDLQRALKGITPKVLTRQLRDLERDGLISRVSYPEIPPRVEYSLTPLGRSLQPALADLFSWAHEHAAELGGRSKAVA
ncbi:MAG: helix-turn-helix transcriptional regulator [Candidatus Eremiobacteraeota bacterium]|nr:helix-turn-helix transcriptional regulator [Candidatus Eremiobacteraeota bacterium]MBC5826981.1 helix-turn-helix transcriptional regulator [Candidatus Eremiobacteraeota bacterium]